MPSKLVYTTETPYVRRTLPLSSGLCDHGTDAGQTCYPCDDPGYGFYGWDWPTEISDMTDAEMEELLM
jgi:hypothetical protein